MHTYRLIRPAAAAQQFPESGDSSLMFYAAVVVPALGFPIPVFAWIDTIAIDRNPV